MTINTKIVDVLLPIYIKNTIYPTNGKLAVLFWEFLASPPSPSAFWLSISFPYTPLLYNVQLYFNIMSYPCQQKTPQKAFFYIVQTRNAYNNWEL